MSDLVYKIIETQSELQGSNEVRRQVFTGEQGIAEELVLENSGTAEAFDVVVKDGNNTRVIGWDGEFIIRNRKTRGKTRIVSRKGRDFLKRFGDTHTLLDQIRRLSSRKKVGDLILFGNYHYGKIVAFGNYYATHGGIGKKMCAPFFMSKQGFDLREVNDPDKLYDLFKSYL